MDGLLKLYRDLDTIVLLQDRLNVRQLLQADFVACELVELDFLNPREKVQEVNLTNSFMLW